MRSDFPLSYPDDFFNVIFLIEGSGVVGNLLMYRDTSLLTTPAFPNDKWSGVFPPSLHGAERTGILATAYTESKKP
jgi:hypothetical protein